MIYLDNSATTPLCEAAKERMTEAIEKFGNPSSLHSVGLDARELVTKARRDVLAALGVKERISPDSPAAKQLLVFTSGGTEANNLAVSGAAYAKPSSAAKRIISTDSEHASISAQLDRLESEGFEIVRLSTHGGELDLDELRKALTKNTVIVSIMYVNNETGAVYDIKSAFREVKRLCPQALTHTDAVQAFGKLDVEPEKLGADLVSVSAHKIHGPKGVGALYIAKPVITAKKLSPVLFGGGQEYSLRSGTENTIGITGFGGAAAAAGSALSANRERLTELRSHLLERLAEQPEIRVNLPENPAPHIISLTLPRIKSETMLHFLSARGICVSSGSACSSNSKHTHRSPALIGFGLEEEADFTIRVSLSPENTAEELDLLCSALADGTKTIIRR